MEGSVPRSRQCNQIQWGYNGWLPVAAVKQGRGWSTSCGTSLFLWISFRPLRGLGPCDIGLICFDTISRWRSPTKVLVVPILIMAGTASFTANLRHLRPSIQNLWPVPWLERPWKTDESSSHTNLLQSFFFPVIAVRVVTTCMFSSESNSGICTLLSQFIMTWAASRTSCQLCEIDKNFSQLPLIILILIVMTFRTLSHTFLRKSGWRAMNVGGYRWHTFGSMLFPS